MSKSKVVIPPQLDVRSEPIVDPQHPLIPVEDNHDEVEVIPIPLESYFAVSQRRLTIRLTKKLFCIIESGDTWL